MEDLLLQIVKDSTGVKFTEVRNVCQEVHDFLEAQQGSLRAPPHELRKRCFNALQLALESHNSKLVSAAVSGFQKLLRDDRFLSRLECESPEQWLPSQLLSAISSLNRQSEDIQVDILKVLLNMACVNWWSMNEDIILRILGICRDCYAQGSTAVTIASQATASQTLRAFCDHLNEMESDNKANPFYNPYTNVNEGTEIVESSFDGIIPIMHDLCKNVQKRPSNLKERHVQFYLECLLTVVSTLPESAFCSSALQSYLWRELCPVLLSLLGPPTSDKGSLATRIPNVTSNHSSLGRVSTKSSSCLTISEVKSVYSICVELVRLVGLIESLRPMLESMFHRILFYTSLCHRLEALRATKEVMRKPERLVNFAGPPLIVDPKGSCSTDLGLLKLAIDAFVECSHSNDIQLCYASIDCVSSLLESLERICGGAGMSSKVVAKLNLIYKDLNCCDYQGPMTYQTWEKLRAVLPLQLSSVSPESSQLTDGDNVVNNNVDIDRFVDCEVNEVSRQREVSDGGANDNCIAEHTCPPVNYETDSSGSTEGPEDVSDDDGIAPELTEDVIEIELARRQRIPQTLIREDGKAEQERVAKMYETRDVYVQHERQNARHFVVALKEAIPTWLAVRSSIEADEILQEFASNYCKSVSADVEQSIHNVIINADGVYLAIYSSLQLNLKLIHSNFYSEGHIPPITEEGFIERVHGSGVLVYLSSDWLAELYQQVLMCDFLGSAGYNNNARDNSSLINLLTDLEGAHSGYLLSDYYRLEKAVAVASSGSDKEAGCKFSRRILTGCWDEVLQVLSTLLKGKNADGVSSNIYQMLGAESAKEEQRLVQDAVANSLDGLQKAARLSNLLNLHSRCESVFALLSAISCPVSTTPCCSTPVYRKKLKKTTAFLYKKRPVKLHVAHVLSMDVLLSQGLELGSYNPECWKHVFRCCLYLAELEHTFFSHGLAQSAAATKSSSQKDVATLPSDEIDDLNTIGTMAPAMTFPSGFLPLSVADFIKQNTGQLSSNGMLTVEQNIQVLCSLSQQVDRLFDDAAYKLNLKAFLGFLTELCLANKNAMFSENARCATSNDTSRPDSACRHYNSRGKTLLLHRLGDVMLKCVRSGRPLVHVMQSWSVFGLHLMEAACHKDHEVAKHAVRCIHDIVSALLNNQSELPYFHFNEALFKPFENLLCLELCDVDIQDQIISSICEFVEASKSEIRSGWRPLFGTLRAVRVSSSPKEAGDEDAGLHSNHLHSVLDVFDAFFKMDNVLVFANAAVDCILCLLKYIKGNISCDLSDSNVSSDLCLASLKCIHTCCGIMSTMYQMPVCPLFCAATRIQSGTEPQFVDAEIPGYCLISFGGKSKDSSRSSDSDVMSSDVLRAKVLDGGVKTLEELEQPSGILHVWCLILEGLIDAVANCPRCYQPYTAETLFYLFRKIYELPGVEFGLYVINHILLPMMQSWLRRMAKVQFGVDGFVSNFKQCCGQTTDLVVDYIAKLSDSDQLSKNGMLLLHQLFLLMTECIAQPNESISHLGCSCIRHVILASGPLFTPVLWDVSCEALRTACDVSLFFVRQLMVAFKVDSDNFYGDMAQVKVAANSDCTPLENERLMQAAQQVFLLDNQRSMPSGFLLEDPVDDDRSYTFLLYPPHVVDQDEIAEAGAIVKVPFRFMVVGLVSHQILLQTVAVILLHGVRHVVPSLANVLLLSPVTSTGLQPKSELPGLMRFLSEEQLSSLLDCLKQSYDVSCQFDVRPGLKFLVQKVARASAAANLYQQSGASWTIRAVALLELCLQQLRKGDRNACALLGRGEFCFSELQDMLKETCASYAELFTRKDDDRFAVLRDRPIFFLVAHADDFLENRYKVEDTTTTKQQHAAGDGKRQSESSEGTSDSPKEELGSEELGEVGTKAELHSPPEAAQDALAELQSKDDGGGGEEGATTSVYEVVTQKDIDGVFDEYKRRKQQHVMPTTKRDRPRGSEARHGPQERELTKLPSVLKDHEACIKVRTEMLLSIFDVFCQMDDEQFQRLLPVTFPFVRTLVAHGNDQTLRQTLAEYLDRIGLIYSFSAENAK